MMELNGKRVMVVGLGESGYAASRAACELGAMVTVVDGSASPLRADTAAELEAMGVEVRLNEPEPEDIRDFDLVVKSPGVPDKAGVMDAARSAGVRVISELEMGYRLLENRIIAVTGTNGKTTTTKLIGSILRQCGVGAVTCGNIGNPLVGCYGRSAGDDVMVVEVSSFQLMHIESFRPDIAVVLNLSPDHFDWHRDFDEYRSAKARIVENQGEADLLVYNEEDPFCRELAGRTRGSCAGFGLEKPPGAGLWIREGWIWAGEPLSGATRVLPLEEIGLVGKHNLANIMAATGAALAAGCEPQPVREAVAGFKGLEHRMEYVESVKGVAFYNDSKATNPHATLHALESFNGPVVVILGGRNKGLDFTDLALALCALMRSGRLRGIVLMGECSEELHSVLVKNCKGLERSRVTFSDDLDVAASRAFQMCRGEGVVLFSPAAASFDMFSDYRERGEAYKQAVLRLKGVE